MWISRTVTKTFTWIPKCPKFCFLLLWQKQLKEKGSIWLMVPGSSPSLRGNQGSKNLKLLVPIHPVKSREQLINAHMLTNQDPISQRILPIPGKLSQPNYHYMTTHLRYAHKPWDLDNPLLSPFSSDSTLCQVNDSK